MLSRTKQYLVLIAASAIFFTLFQWSPTLADPDSFYHARMTTEIVEHGLVAALPWAQFTTLRAVFTDHHLLYHLLVIPLLPWLPAITAVKVLQVICLVGLMVLLFGYLRWQRLPYALLGMVGLVTVAPWLVRLNLVKATPLALLCLLAVTGLLLRKHYVFAMIVTAVYTWVHAGFVLAVLVAGCLVLAETVALSFQARRWQRGRLTPLLATISGCLVGVLVNPYFPYNLLFYWQQLIQIGIVNYHQVIEVGAEWYPFTADYVVAVFSIALISIIGAIVVSVQQWQKFRSDQRWWSWLLLAVMMTALMLRSRRYVEYAVPWLWLWTTYVVLPYLASAAARRQYHYWRQWLGRWFRPLAMYLVVAISFSIGKTVWSAYDTVTDGIAINHLQAASQYLAQHASPGATIFHGQWDDFPVLYYHNPNNYYIVGLDPTFMYLYDAKLYQRWYDISHGLLKQHTASAIVDTFASRYVIIDTTDEQTQLLNAYLRRDPNTTLEFEDSSSRVYHIQL